MFCFAPSGHTVNTSALTVISTSTRGMSYSAPKKLFLDCNVYTLLDNISVWEAQI